MPETLIRIEALPHVHQLDQYRIIELPMTAEDRRRVRRRIMAPDGQELALELPTGTVLNVGQVLAISGTQAYIVGAAPEEVLVIYPHGLAEAAFVGHLIGNLHREIDLDGESIVALWDAPLEARLEKAGLTFARAQRPFHGRPPGEHSH